MNETVHVVVIGGGPAGLTAALYLGRAKKSVVVIDRGHPRHGVAEGVHNFLTRDGMPPSALRSTAWEQMAAYPTVAHREDAVVSVTRRDERWVVETASGDVLSADAILLATGVIDDDPGIDGVAERWGHAVHQCPFCHGWELRNRPLGAVISGEGAAHYTTILRHWSRDVMLFTNGGALSDDDRAAIEAAGIPIEETPIAGLDGPAPELERVRLTDGRSIERRGLFVRSGQTQVEIVRALDLALDEQGYVEVDPFGATSLPGVWAAGDLTSPIQQVVIASAQGARAGVMIINALPAP